MLWRRHGTARHPADEGRKRQQRQPRPVGQPGWKAEQVEQHRGGEEQQHAHGAGGDGIRNRYVSPELSVAPPPGRTDQVVRLSEAIDGLRDGRGGVALLTGDGGVD